MRVLTAVEDDQFGSAVVDYLTSHQWMPGTIIKILHVVEPSIVGDNITAVYGGGIDHEIMEDRVKHGSALINKLRDRLQASLGNSIPIEVNVVIGRPHHVILQTADEWKADMIVVGSHGKSGFSRFLLGSVSLSVVSNANCSVTVVRLPKQAVTESKPEKARAVARK